MVLSRVSNLGCIAALCTAFGAALWLGVFTPARIAHAQDAPVGATQFTGEAGPPESPLSLWYRRPAADHPFAPAVGKPAIDAATAEWVKALPVGNGRLGAMIFGGVVNERLQLN